jgi:tRNA threonylcarbamoyladenosine biosynthesis protein TsaE
MEILTQSAQDTFKLGQKIGINIAYKVRTVSVVNQARILAFYGELGSGKTTFIQGFCNGLGLPHRIVSPTFIINKRYKLNLPQIKWLHHIDLYRLEKINIEEIGLREIFSDPYSLVLIEWADRINKILPQATVNLKFTIKNDNQRLINIDGLNDIKV